MKTKTKTKNKKPQNKTKQPTKGSLYWDIPQFPILPLVLSILPVYPVCCCCPPAAPTVLPNSESWRIWPPPSIHWSQPRGPPYTRWFAPERTPRLGSGSWRKTHTRPCNYRCSFPNDRLDLQDNEYETIQSGSVTTRSNYIHYMVWDEIIYPFRNFNGCTDEVWEWISIFIPQDWIQQYGDIGIAYNILQPNKNTLCLTPTG